MSSSAMERLRPDAWLAVAVAALAGPLAVAGAGLWAVADPRWWQGSALVLGLAWYAAALAVRPGRPGGRGGDAWTCGALLVTGGSLVGAAALVPLGVPLGAVGDLMWLGLALALPAALLGYPYGAPRRRADRAALGLLLVLAALGLQPQAVPGVPADELVALRSTLGCLIVLVLGLAWWWRGRSADAGQRTALLWPAVGAGTAFLALAHVAFAAEPTAGSSRLAQAAGLLVLLVLPAAVALGLTAPLALDVRRLLSTVAVAFVMVDLTVAASAGMLAGWSWAAGDTTKGSVAVVVTVCAAAFGPVAVRVRRATEETFFGAASDPLAAMSRLGTRLGADSSPTAWAEALRGALAVPRVQLYGDGVLLGESRSPGGLGAAESVALVAGGEPVGELVVTLPAETARLPRSTKALLDLVAAPLARALQAVGLAEQLQASRESVVQAREEERRRLRRDLHDGLGPVLTGVAYTADAASNLLHSDAEQALALLRQLRADTSGAITEVRRIVAGLRPPALDEVGLVGALRQHVTRLGGAVEVEIRSSLPAAEVAGGLPAAVEVVAYRVAVEALTNAVRHARARNGGPARAVVRLDRSGGDLVVTVHDDGAPVPGWTPGTGLASMRERCAEVGGALEAGPTPEGGRVIARLPLGGDFPA